jgi:flagellar biosynthesis/type III secretory pathway protein FliH
VNGEREPSATERESVYQRLQREIREGKEEGIRQGLLWGREEGREKGREALLRIIASVAPDELPSLRSIEDLDALERAVTERLLRGR